MIYIIYDTALNGPYTLMLLQNAYPDNRYLFKGTKDENLSDVAPYLFMVDESLFEKINDPIVSLDAIVIVESEEKITDLLAHLQQFIYRKINGQENYFRFWDARVLARFLPACTDEKLKIFFEGIKCFYVLDKEKTILNSFYLKRDKLQTGESALNKMFGLAHIEEQGMHHDPSALTGTEEVKKVKRKFF